jgi:two-component system CheB/CheR fusion protein
MSIDEELARVNNQLQNRVTTVESAHSNLGDLLSSTGIAILFLDHGLHIRRFTPATTKLMNLIPADVGRPVGDIATRFSNDNLQADCHKVLEELRPVEREISTDSGDWYLRRIQPYRTHDDRIEGTLVTFTDVTAIKRRDEEHARLVNIIESSENAIIGTTLDGIITSWSPGAEATLGYRASEMIGETLDRVFPQRDREEATGTLEELGAGHRVGPYETEGRRKDGSRLDLSVSIYPIIDSAGQAIAVSTIARDITEHKRAERALLDADRHKDEFLVILGHELRNPLAPIRNAIDLLTLQDDLPEKVRWAVDVIGRQTEQLERLVNDLLDVSRIARGEIQMRRQEVGLQDTIRNAVQNVAHLVERYRHTLDIRLAEEPVVVMGDPLRLAQVFTNLLSNAARYTPEDGHIQIRLSREQRRAVARIRDDGVGIRTDDLEHLFDIFTRGTSWHPHFRVSDGLGVGLAFSRRLVELHGGILQGYSDGPGKGSEFVVSLPAGLPQPSASCPQVPKARTEAKSRPRRVLLVDDNPDFIDSFTVLLDTMGHEVRPLATGRDVLAAIREFRPEIVFLDISMPDRDGHQVAAAIHAAKLSPRPLLVALTGYAQDMDRNVAMEAGFDRFELKPLKIQQVHALLAQLG